MSAVGNNASGLDAEGGGSLGLRFVLLVIVCVALMVADQRTHYLSSVRQGLSLAVYPVQAVVNLPFEAWHKASKVMASRDQLLERNEALQRKLLLANAHLERFEALEAENRRLRDLLDSTARLGDQLLVAEVMAVDLDPYRQRFTVNRGTLDGAFVGQPLLDAKGVVGQLIRVGPLTSKALLITDADHAVPVVINRNGLRTIAVGTGDSGQLRLPYLTNSADVRVGDVLLTSGLGGIFPAGYPVGRVVQVTAQPGQGFANVVAKPAATLNRDHEVLLVFAPDENDNESRKRRTAAETDGKLAVKGNLVTVRKVAQTPPQDFGEAPE